MTVVDVHPQVRHHPVVVASASRSGPPTSSFGSPIAITAFAGSMRFVYIHAAVFAIVDARVREEPVAHADTDRLARGDLPLDLRDDRPKSPRGVSTGQGRSRLHGRQQAARREHGPHTSGSRPDGRAASSPARPQRRRSDDRGLASDQLRSAPRTIRRLVRRRASHMWLGA